MAHLPGQASSKLVRQRRLRSTALSPSEAMRTHSRRMRKPRRCWLRNDTMLTSTLPVSGACVRCARSDKSHKGRQGSHGACAIQLSALPGKQ